MMSPASQDILLEMAYLQRNVKNVILICYEFTIFSIICNLLSCVALFEDDGAGVKDLNDRYDYLIPLMTQYLFMSNDSEQYAQCGSTIKNKYFGDKKIGKDTAKELVMVGIDFFVMTLKIKIVLFFLYIYNSPPCNSLFFSGFSKMSYLAN